MGSLHVCGAYIADIYIAIHNSVNCLGDGTMTEKGGLRTVVVHAHDTRMPTAFFDARSLRIVKLLKNKELLPEDICSKTSYDEKTVIPILLDLHVHGVLKRKQKGFKGYYSISEDKILVYCKRLKALSEKWEVLLKEVESKK